MNHLDVRSHLEPSLNQIVAELLVDGELVADFLRESLSVDLSALEMSTHRSGEFYIITCMCGYPSCAGIERGVTVEQAGTRIEWAISIAGATQLFSFDRQDYRSAVRRGIEKIRQLSARTGVEAAPDIIYHYFSQR